MVSMDSFVIHKGKGPFIATAIHDGHAIDDSLKDFLNLDDAGRLREEDPFTGFWVEIADSWIKVNDSRFEYDLNRPRNKAVYVKPEDAWGLKVWKTDLNDQQIEQSLQKYDHFYNEVKKFLDKKVEEYGGFIIYDLHTYNHRREGENGAPADPEKNPDINIGTGSLDSKWAPVVNQLIEKLSSYDYLGQNLDVRENVKFKGGYFSQWVHENYSGKSCVLSIEVKKIFMDEWTGKPDDQQVLAIKDVLKSTIPSVMEQFNKVMTSSTSYGNY